MAKGDDYYLIEPPHGTSLKVLKDAFLKLHNKCIDVGTSGLTIMEMEEIIYPTNLKMRVYMKRISELQKLDDYFGELEIEYGKDYVFPLIQLRALHNEVEAHQL
jgi:hypothetical protein